MSYFTNRPRAYSKPTKEETKELSNHLSKFSAQDLRHFMLSAASESPGVTQLFMKIMKDADSTFQTHLQPVQPNQQYTTANLCDSNTGLLTPIDLSEDSEMSGTENVQAQGQQHSIRPEPFTSTPTCFASPDTSHLDIPSLKRPNKRKSLADRDDNIPSQNPPPSSAPPHSLSHLKRRKPSAVPPSESNQNKTHCLNCGLWTPTTKFENLHGCIYHPGDFAFDGTVTSWSCCGNRGLGSRGCLITRHKVRSWGKGWVGVFESERGNENENENENGDGDGLVDAFGGVGGNYGNGNGYGQGQENAHGHERMSQYARLMAIKG